MEALFQPLCSVAALRIILKVALNTKSNNGTGDRSFKVFSFQSDKYLNHKTLEYLWFNIKEYITLENMKTKEKIQLTYLEYIMFKIHLDRLYKWITNKKYSSQIWREDNTLDIEMIKANKEMFLLEITNAFGGTLLMMPSTLLDERDRKIRGIELRFSREQDTFIFLTKQELLLLIESIKLIDIKSCSYSLMNMWFNNQDRFNGNDGNNKELINSGNGSGLRNKSILSGGSNNGTRGWMRFGVNSGNNNAVKGENVSDYGEDD